MARRRNPLFGLFGRKPSRQLAPARRYYVHNTKRAAQAAARAGDVIVKVQDNRWAGLGVTGWYAGPASEADSRIRQYSEAFLGLREALAAERKRNRRRPRAA